MKDLEEKSIESDDWKLSDRDLDSVSFNVIKNTIEELMKENYGDFVRAIISIESGIEDLDIFPQGLILAILNTEKGRRMRPAELHNI